MTQTIFDLWIKQSHMWARKFFQQQQQKQESQQLKGLLYDLSAFGRMKIEKVVTLFLSVQLTLKCIF